MGPNKFTLKIKFSSGVFPAKAGSSSFALTPLCCSRVAKNCKSSLLLHGFFFGFVVFRLREWAPGQKMVSATASQAGPWPHMHQSMFLLLGLPCVWVLPSLPCPQEPWQSCSAVLAPSHCPSAAPAWSQGRLLCSCPTIFSLCDPCCEQCHGPADLSDLPLECALQARADCVWEFCVLAV